MQCRKIFLPSLIAAAIHLTGCSGGSNKTPAIQAVAGLKEGRIISCGNESATFGTVSFTATVPADLKREFNTGVALLHSFEYDEAEKVFASVIKKDPGCAMAYWGVAMANFHPLWAPPDSSELVKGMAVLQEASKISSITPREMDYIKAIGQFYNGWENQPHMTRVRRFETAMGELHAKYPDDIDAAVFYALALDAAAERTDKTYSRQKKAFAILLPIFEKEPLHPGAAHLIIHSCDYPVLASQALTAARRYAAVAPSSAHAQHMPSHIFTRLGYWNECINSNRMAAASAVCYAEQSGREGHWDEELHALDYLMYAYLQQQDDAAADSLLGYVNSIRKVWPANFKTAHAFAAIPARVVMERKQWAQAAVLPLHPAAGNWSAFPWQQGIVRLARLLGHVHLDESVKASAELNTLTSLHSQLLKAAGKANEAALVNVQVKTGQAWILFYNGDKRVALDSMKHAADLEDNMEKHPVTPGEVIPARELYADMLMLASRYSDALAQYKEVLTTHPNRRNALKGAAEAALKAVNTAKAAGTAIQKRKPAPLPEQAPHLNHHNLNHSCEPSLAAYLHPPPRFL